MLADDQPLFFTDQLLVMCGEAREAGVEIGKLLFVLSVAEKPGRKVREIVTRGSPDRPGVGKFFLQIEDLFHRDIKRSVFLPDPSQIGHWIV